MKKTLHIALAATLAGLAANVRADAPVVTVSGYGTGALTMSDTDQAEFVTPNQAAGVKKQPRPGADSKLGLQATAVFNDALSLTGQGLVHKYGRDHFGAELTLAFVKMKASDDVSVRLGRIGLPAYLVSDYRSVGYANLMLRAPIELYGQVVMEYFDGADIVYQHTFGATALTAQFGAGNNKTKVPGGSEFSLKPLTSLHVVAENGPFTVRLGRVGARFSSLDNADLAALVAGVNGAGFPGVADALKVADAKGSFTSLGLGLDWRDIIVQAEIAKRKTNARVVPDTRAWYAMVAYRAGQFTPYFQHAAVTQGSARAFAELPLTGPYAALSAGANGAIRAGLQTSNAIGLRWDFHKSAALKLQMDRIAPRDGAGLFVNAAPGFHGPVRVYAAAVDFVF